MPNRLLLLLLCSLMLAPGLFGAADHVWIEGEKPTAGGEQLTTDHWFGSPHPELSGGVSLGGNAYAGLFLEYEVEAPAAGDYQAFVRRFWNHGPFRWRIGQGEWRELREGDFIQETNLGQHVISWLSLGTVPLAKGRQTLRIEALKADGPFVIDCLAFVKGPFSPAGTLRPGEKFGKAEPGTWAFEPEVDGFRADPLNLRALNEQVAGESGRIQVDAKGDFIDGRGKPIRFWAGVTWLMERKGTALMAPHAKHLAKRGVNMIRVFGFLNPKSDGGRGVKPDEAEIDETQKAVAFMKREGIYTTFVPYWAGFAGAPPQSTLYWDETLQSEYKAWVKELLTRPNPYDEKKTPLGRDPALAIFQIQNEDSLFFWTTMAVLKDEALRKITTRYHAWRAENRLAGTPALDFKFWEMAQPNQDHKDTMRFFAELQREWNVEVERFLREECDCQALVNSGNWRTADQMHLLDLDRWSTDGNAVIANNRYINNVHVNPSEAHKAGYAVSVGDLFVDQSKLMDWPALATNARQVAGKAYIVPESTWVPPGSFLSEGPLLVAAYSALTGVDAFYWFSLGSVGFDSTVNKWQTATPSVMGGWPAASFLFRNGLVARGAPAVHEERALEDLWNLNAPLLCEEAGFDPNRDANISPRSNIGTAVDPVAYLVGPVEVKYGGDPAKSKVMDLTPFVDKATGKVTSNTREITLDPRTGLCLVDAPAAQGATGFLAKAGRIELGALTIESRCEYATVLAVALDSKPLATSKRVLLQITTQHRPYGWKQSPATFTHEKKEYQGFRIDSLGSLPWNVVDTDVTLTLTNPGLRTVKRLDENLYPTSDAVEVKREGKGLRITPPRNTMYLLVE